MRLFWNFMAAVFLGSVAFTLAYAAGRPVWLDITLTPDATDCGVLTASAVWLLFFHR